ncbi:glycosyltransferase family 2 protein [Gryllotalpicola kribbensis]|jgi:N-acetylglucosaminyl-diphospho-decaprenol L-rhamnosyltransferase|uniref:Glycosyltransferase family 2 protein n=2 Tax=Gryllotalpicola kribbensis TaxID=993084 RepID=A0ABP8AQY3_9MICO
MTPELPHTASALAVVTVSYHSQGALRELVGSLARSELVPTATIVVDNARDDGLDLPTLDGLEVVAAPTNLGYGGGINFGARRLPQSVEWILITNPDVTFTEHAISTLLAVASEQPDAGAVGPRVLESDGETYPSARELPSLRTGIGHALFANVWLGNPWTRRYRGENRVTTGTWRETGWLSGSCLLVRRSAFEAIGGFDESYFMYFEDVDLGARLAQAGWRNLYVPGAVVTHTGAHSTTNHASAMRREHHRSAYLYLSRKYSAPYLWPLRIGLKIALSVRARFTSRG